jgi:hypothetical protein
MNSKLPLTATAALIGTFGLGWLIVPGVMGWRIGPVAVTQDA